MVLLQKFVVALSLLVLWLCECCNAQWSADGKISTGSSGSKLDLGLHRTSGDWTFSGTGWTDFKGGWGAGVGFKVKFRRSAPLLKQFHLFIKVNPCHFDVYDENGDGVTTLEEIKALFDDGNLAMELFDALDTVKGDGGVTAEEFNNRADKVIAGC